MDTLDPRRGARAGGSVAAASRSASTPAAPSWSKRATRAGRRRARALAPLAPEQREVLVLRLLGERCYKEIAEITGKKIGTVGWLSAWV